MFNHFITTQRISISLLLLSTCQLATADNKQLTMDMQDLMNWVLNPAAEAIWDSAGYVITAEGEIDLSPTTEDGWQQVEAGAAMVAESAHLLTVSGRSRGPAWDAFAQGLIITGKKALSAAEAKDANALFDAGGEIYQVCRGCHDQFWMVLDDYPAFED